MEDTPKAARLPNETRWGRAFMGYLLFAVLIGSFSIGANIVTLGIFLYTNFIK